MEALRLLEERVLPRAGQEQSSIETLQSTRVRDKFQKAVELLQSQGGALHTVSKECAAAIVRFFFFTANGIVVCMDFSLITQRVQEVHVKSFLKDIVNSRICALYAEPAFPLCTVLESRTLYFIHSNSPQDSLLSYDVKNLVIHYLDVQIQDAKTVQLSPEQDYIVVASVRAIEVSQRIHTQILRLRKDMKRTQNIHTFQITSLYHFPCTPNLILFPDRSLQFWGKNALLALSQQQGKLAVQTFFVQKEGLTQFTLSDLKIQDQGTLLQYSFSQALNKLAILDSKLGLITYLAQKQESLEQEDEKEEEKLKLTKIASWNRKPISEVKWYGHHGTLLLCLAQIGLIVMDSTLYVHRVVVTQSLSSAGIDRFWEGQSFKGLPQDAHFIACEEYEPDGKVRKENKMGVLVEIESSKEIIMYHFDAHSAASFPAPFQSLSQSDLAQIYIQAVESNPLAFFARLVNFIATIDSGEQLLSALMQTTNLLLSRRKILEQVLLEDVKRLLSIFQEKKGLDYIRNSITVAFTKICFKYLARGHFTNAFRLASQARLPYVLKVLKESAREKGQHSLVASVLYFQQQEEAKANAEERPNDLARAKHDPLGRALSQIGNFARRDLSKEALQHLSNDFQTIIQIDDIEELDLSDFNTYDINLKDYTKALTLQFQGKLKEALQIYEKMNLKNDCSRLENLLGEVEHTRSMAERTLVCEDMEEELEF